MDDVEGEVGPGGQVESGTFHIDQGHFPDPALESPDDALGRVERDFAFRSGAAREDGDVQVLMGGHGYGGCGEFSTFDYCRFNPNDGCLRSCLKTSTRIP